VWSPVRLREFARLHLTSGKGPASGELDRDRVVTGG